MPLRLLLGVVAGLILCVPGCSATSWSQRRLPSGMSPVSEAAPVSHEPNDATRRSIYLIGHGRHTGLVLAVNDVSPEIWPEVTHFRELDFVEFGWGDECAYRVRRFNVPVCLRAACWPTPSVVHAAGFRGPVLDFYPQCDVVEIRLERRRFDSMCRFIAGTVTRDDSGSAMPLGPGLYGESVFYRANGSYFFPKTCNVWTARALCEAGLPIRVSGAVRADSLLAQARHIGIVQQPASHGLKRSALLRNSLETSLP